MCLERYTLPAKFAFRIPIDNPQSKIRNFIPFFLDIPNIRPVISMYAEWLGGQIG